ncbi:MAG: hypothetical protein HQK83_00765 [Fibrobacteria bacterium]|nr:hypothetical protein [Fibrobacteria bacterium]
MTRVIQSQIQALSRYFPAYQPHLLVGAKPNIFPDGIETKNITIYPDLNYLAPDLTPSNLKQIKEKLYRFLHKKISLQDIIHVHNINLGKNPIAALAVYEMALEGYQIINHCHDFAEDGRYVSYKFLKHIIEEVFRRPLPEVLYPSLPKYFYAVLNSRDYGILKFSGIPVSNIKLLFNPVVPGNNTKHQPYIENEIKVNLGITNSLPLFVYPVRGIRRKNIGEFLLLAALFQDSANWLLTQPPQNPSELQNYRFWEKITRLYSLPVIMAAGQKVEYVKLVQGAQKLITTSIIEGFGMSFLEPWLYNKEVAGRDIPEITSDFKAMGIRYNRLYNSIRIPVRWVPEYQSLPLEYLEYIQSAYKPLGIKIPDDSKSKIKKRLFQSGTIDFAVLDNKRQAHIIKKVTTSHKNRQSLIKSNNLQNFACLEASNFIKTNKRLVQKKLHLRQYGAKLNGLYRQLKKDINHSTIIPLKTRNRVASSFLGIDNFFLLRK